jgi:gliding motility-associated protein GldL
MAQKKSIFNSKGWKNGMKYLYGWGAAVVILGALFKILHFPGANEMLIVGLGTEAVIFFFSAFEPLPEDEEHWRWDKVFPQLAHADDDDDEIDMDSLSGGSAGAGVLASGLGKTSQLLQENALTPDLFENLSESIKGLKVNVQNLADISDTTVATNEFSQKLKQASNKIDELSKGYSFSVESMNELGSSLSSIKNSQEQIITAVSGYQQQIVLATTNLSSLNSVYELELQDAQKHINSINKFYGSISGVMQNLLDTSSDTDSLRTEVSNLATNMQRLNTIYGNMLSAMASGK